MALLFAALSSRPRRLERENAASLVAPCFSRRVFLQVRHPTTLLPSVSARACPVAHDVGGVPNSRRPSCAHSTRHLLHLKGWSAGPSDLRRIRSKAGVTRPVSLHSGHVIEVTAAHKQQQLQATSEQTRYPGSRFIIKKRGDEASLCRAGVLVSSWQRTRRVGLHAIEFSKHAWSWLFSMEVEEKFGVVLPL